MKEKTKTVHEYHLSSNGDLSSHFELQSTFSSRTVCSLRLKYNFSWQCVSLHYGVKTRLAEIW